MNFCQCASQAIPPPTARSSTSSSQLQPPVDAISSPSTQSHEAAQDTRGARRECIIPPLYAAPQAAALPPTESINDSSLGSVSHGRFSQSSYYPTGTGSSDNLVTEQLGTVDRRGRASLPPLPQLRLLTVATAPTPTPGSAASLPDRVAQSTYLPLDSAGSTLSTAGLFVSAETNGMGRAIHPLPKPPIPTAFRPPSTLRNTAVTHSTSAPAPSRPS